MIVLGITPGLRALAYSVIGWGAPGERAELIDADILRAGRKVDPNANLAALLMRAHPHRLILSVVFERNPPAVLGIGPAYSKKEPQLHVEAVRKLASLLAGAFSVPHESFPDRKDLLSVFPTQTTLRNITLAHVRAESLRDNNALLLATITAVAAAERVKQCPIP